MKLAELLVDVFISLIKLRQLVEQGELTAHTHIIWRWSRAVRAHVFPTLKGVAFESGIFCGGGDNFKIHPLAGLSKIPNPTLGWNVSVHVTQHM